MDSKWIEEALKIFLSLAIGAIFFGLGQLLKNAANARVREVELRRDLEHLKRSQKGHSTALVAIDDTIGILNDRLTKLEAFTEHSQGFFRPVTKQ